VAAYISNVLVDVCMSHCNEPSGDMKCGEFGDYVRNFQVLKKDSASWIRYLSSQPLMFYPAFQTCNLFFHVCVSGKISVLVYFN
jgi:hypothetical protein